MEAKEETQNVAHTVATDVILIRDEKGIMVRISTGDRLDEDQHLRQMDQQHRLNAENCLLPLEVLQMAPRHLPSPRQAQQGRHHSGQPEQ